MTASAEPRLARPRPCGSRTSTSSGIPRAAPRRCTRCSACTRRSSCPTSRSRGGSPPICASASRPRRRRATRRRSSSTRRCSSPPAPGQLVGEASPSYLRSRVAAEEIARRAPGRADRRRVARAGRVPSLDAPRDGPEPGRGRARPAPRDGRRGDACGRAGRRAGSPRRRCCATPTASATSSSCAATRTVRARSGAGADLRRLPRRQRGDVCGVSCASSASTTSSPSSSSRRTRACGCARCAATTPSTR